MTNPRDPPVFVLNDAADSFLVDRAIDGDTQAFAILVNRYIRLLRACAHRILGTFGSSDDIVQEALLTVWQQLPTLEDRTAIRSWMVRITTRKAFDLARTFKNQEPLDNHDRPIAEALRPEGLVEASSLEHALTHALAALPAQQGQAWQLREFAGLSYDEIAHEMDLSVPTVRGLLSRARRTLMTEMGGWR